MVKLTDRLKAAAHIFRYGVSGQAKGLPFAWPVMTAGTPEWHLVDLKSYIDEGYSMNALVYSAIMYKVRATMTAPLRAYSGTEQGPEPLPKNSPLAMRLARPNKDQSWVEFQARNMVFLNLSGNVYIYIDPDSGEMHSLRPDRMYIVPNKSKPAELKGFLYVPEGKSVASVRDCIPILPEEMLHIKLPNPADPLEGLGYGMSPLMPAAQVIDVDNMVTNFLNIFFKRGAMVTGVLKFDRPIREDVADKIIERWEEKYGGYENWTVGVLDRGGSYERTSLTFEEMGFEAVDGRGETRILGPFGVAPILVGAKVGLEASTYCLPWNAKVSTSSGPVNIKDIEVGNEVWSFIEDHLELRKVVKSGKVGRKKIYEIRTKNNTLYASGNHPVLVLAKGDGRVLANEYRSPYVAWVRVDQLEVGDKVIQPKSYPDGDRKRCRKAGLSDQLGAYKIKSIIPQEVEDVYDISVEEGNSFVADGIVVHNSNYEAARQAVWEDTLIPELTWFEVEYQYQFNTDTEFVQFDFSRVPALQRALPRQVEAAFTLVQIGVPPNQALRAAGLRIGDIPDGDKPRIMTGTGQGQGPRSDATTDDFGMREDVPE